MESILCFVDKPIDVIVFSCLDLIFWKSFGPTVWTENNLQKKLVNSEIIVNFRSNGNRNININAVLRYRKKLRWLLHFCSLYYCIKIQFLMDKINLHEEVLFNVVRANKFQKIITHLMWEINSRRNYIFGSKISKIN